MGDLLFDHSDANQLKRKNDWRGMIKKKFSLIWALTLYSPHCLRGVPGALGSLGCGGERCTGKVKYSSTGRSIFVSRSFHQIDERVPDVLGSFILLNPSRLL